MTYENEPDFVDVVIHIKGHNGGINQTMIFPKAKSLTYTAKPDPGEISNISFTDNCNPLHSTSYINLEFKAHYDSEIGGNMRLYDHRYIEDEELYELDDFLRTFTDEQRFDMAKRHIEKVEEDSVNAILDSYESVVIKKLQERGYSIYEEGEASNVDR